MVSVTEKVMVGGDKWPTLEIEVWATTKILHAMSPAEALKLAGELTKTAHEHQQYNQELEEAKWEARGGYPEPIEYEGGFSNGMDFPDIQE